MRSVKQLNLSLSVARSSARQMAAMCEWEEGGTAVLSSPGAKQHETLLCNYQLKHLRCFLCYRG